MIESSQESAIEDDPEEISKMEIFNEIKDDLTLLNVIKFIDIFCIGFFTVEFLLRFMFCPCKKRFMVFTIYLFMIAESTNSLSRHPTTR